MALKQDLQFEAQCLKTLISANGIQPTPKMNAIIKIAKTHLKVLNGDLKQINSKKPIPNVVGLNFDERVELHLESARAFIESVIGVPNGR